MNVEHVISEELLHDAQAAFSINQNWVAYNTISYFLKDGDMYFFKEKDEALEFSDNNISEYDNYRVIYARSLSEMLKQIPYGQELEKQLLNSQNLSIMNEKNLEALKTNLKNLGFGEGLNEQLEKSIKEQKPEFNLAHQVEYNHRKINFDLSFRAGEQNEMYFFNRYKATLAEQPERSQTFFLDRGNGVTSKEAFNLLEGRAVNKDLTNKEGEKYNAWVQLDFSRKEEHGNYKLNRYHENYNYNFKAEIDKLILKPMLPDQEKQFVKSLEKGNIQSAVFLKDGQEVKLYVEASPKDRTLNFYDGKMNRLSEEQKADFIDLKSTKVQKQNQDVAGGGDEDGPELKKKRTRSQKNGMSV